MNWFDGKMFWRSGAWSDVEFMLTIRSFSDSEHVCLCIKAKLCRPVDLKSGVCSVFSLSSRSASVIAFLLFLFPLFLHEPLKWNPRRLHVCNWILQIEPLGLSAWDPVRREMRKRKVLEVKGSRCEGGTVSPASSCSRLSGSPKTLTLMQIIVW